MSKVHNNKVLLERRVELRRGATPQEEILWTRLRGNKLGKKFKRQHSIGGYITDFYCAEKKLIVELDGSVHKTQDAREYDKVRNKYFRDLGYQVLRFWNGDVDKNLSEVLRKIKMYL
jgi:very-short-patch-repair endonuclease